jgi:sulfur relay (sulfurtransferase) complex TusBCD TusD component (DsrE family)
MLMPTSARLATMLIRIISALLLVLMTGCSAVKLVYNNAPSITYWWLDGYLDFNDAQSLQVRDGLTTLHTWHRAQALPIYAQTLQKMQQLVPDKVTPEQLCTVATEVRGFTQHIGVRAAEPLSKLTPTLRPEQFKYLVQQYEKKNKKWRDEWLDVSPEALIDHRVKVGIDRLQNIYGRLHESQRAALRQGIVNSAFDANLSYKEIQRRQQDILRTLAEHSNNADRPAHVKAEVIALIDRSLNSPDAAYRQQQERMISEGCEMMAKLHNSITPAQRSKAMEVLKDYEADARILAAQKP